jgi:hypothetical protein
LDTRINKLGGHSGYLTKRGSLATRSTAGVAVVQSSRLRRPDYVDGMREDKERIIRRRNILATVTVETRELPGNVKRYLDRYPIPMAARSKTVV